MRLWHWLLRWMSQHTEADKLAGCARRYELEQQIHGRFER